ncbi:MAG TPA: PAS domain S-box protein [Bacteroidales bacterium]|nr:PAS domain S-box protein [Bacteroidales bacterium]
MEEKFYQSVIKNARFGYACHEIVFDNNGKPEDFKIIDHNEVFESLTDIDSKNLTGKKVSEILKNNKKHKRGLVALYKRFLSDKKGDKIEFYSERLKRWYDVQIVKGEGDFLVTLFEDVTCLKSLQSELENTGYLLVENERMTQMSTSLAESELSYKSLFDHTIVAIFVLDESGVFLDVNHAAIELYGYDRNEIVGFTPEKLSAPGLNNIEKTMLNIRKAFSGEPQRFDWWGLKKNSDIFPLDVVLNKGLFIGRDVVFAMARDNTELFQTLDALRESEDKYRTLAEQLPVGVYRTTIDGEIVYTNFALVRMLGYDSSEDFQKLNVRDHYANPAIRQKQLKSAGKKSGINLMEFQLKNKIGDLIWARDNSRLIYDKNGEPIYFDGVLEDITEERNIENAIKENEANLKAIIENTLENIWSVNLNYEIQYVNEVFVTAFKQTFGKQLSKGVNIIEALPEHLRELWKGRYDRAFNNEHFIFEERIDIDNTSIYVEVAINPILVDGKVMGLSAYGRDVTEKRIAEQKLVAAKEKAEESDRLKSAFLANMSHEIRTPMSGIIGFLNLLNEPDLSDENKNAYINIVTQSGQRLLETINDIIEISKIESGGLQVNLFPVNVSELFGYYNGFFRQQTNQKGLEYLINNRLPSGVRFFRTDKKKLDSIISNLIKNAIKFTPSGSVEFGCQLDGEKIIFYVKDSGVGIPEERISSVFERFVQADLSTSRTHEGSGLGLSIVNAYVKMLGGSITVESIVGRGTVFTFSLPYVADDGDNNKKEAPVNSDNLTISGKKILIAEDDYASYLYLQKALMLDDVTFIRTINGEDTVEMVRRDADISVVLMDIKMPGMSGLEAARKIREFNVTIPIIAQTAYSLSGDREQAIEAGCNDYLSKPINRKELQKLVSKYIQNRS